MNDTGQAQTQIPPKSRSEKAKERKQKVMEKAANLMARLHAEVAKLKMANDPLADSFQQRLDEAVEEYNKAKEELEKITANETNRKNSTHEKIELGGLCKIVGLDQLERSETLGALFEIAKAGRIEHHNENPYSLPSYSWDPAVVARWRASGSEILAERAKARTPEGKAKEKVRLAQERLWQANKDKSGAVEKAKKVLKTAENALAALDQSESESKAKVKAKPDPKQEPEAKPDSKSAPETKTMPDPKPEAKPDSKPAPETKTMPDPKPENISRKPSGIII